MNNQMNNGQKQVNKAFVEKIAYIITLAIIVVIAVALVQSIRNNNTVQTSKITAEEMKAFADGDNEPGQTGNNEGGSEEQPEEQTQGQVTVYFKRIDMLSDGTIVPGNEISTPEIYTGDIGEEYLTTRKEIDGYKKYDVDPINKIGNYTKDNIEVTYLYQVDSDTVDYDNLNSVVTVTIYKGETLSGIENKLTIQTKDEETEENILGSEYVITDSDNNVVASLEQIVNEIVAGNYTAVPTKQTYKIKQAKSSRGYRSLVNNEISFSIQKVKNENDNDYHVEFEATSNPNVDINYDSDNSKIEVVFKNKHAPDQIKVFLEAQTKDIDTNTVIPNAIYKASEGENIILNDYAAEGKIEVTNYIVFDDDDLGTRVFRIEQVSAPDEYVPLENNVVNVTIETVLDQENNIYKPVVTSDAGANVDVELNENNNTILVTFKNKHVIYKKNMKIVVVTEDFYDSSKKLDATYSAMSRSENQPEEQGEDIVPIGDGNHDYRYEITDIEIGDVALERYTIKQLTVEDRYILNDTRATIVLNKRLDEANNKYEASLADGSSEDIAIVGNEIVVTIKNKKIPDDVTIPVYVEARDKDTNQPIEGGTYNLEEPSGRIIASEDITETNNQLGTITINSTDKLNYIVKQIENPEGYIKITDDIPLVINTKIDINSNTYVSTVETSTVENVTYELRDGALYIIVLNKHVPFNSEVTVYVRTKDNDGNFIKGATYRMTTKNGEEDEEVAQIDTTEDKQLLATIAIDNPNSKSYYVEEIAAPDKYIKTAEKAVINLDNYLNESNNTYQTNITYGTYNAIEIERRQNEITITFGNALNIQKSNLEVYVKTVDKDGNSIVGGKYKLLSATRETIREATEETENLKLTTIEINGDLDRNYFLVEENAPDGYFRFEDEIPFKIKSKINYDTRKFEPVLEKQYQEKIVAKLENNVLTITVTNDKKPDIQNLKVYIITQDLSEAPITGSTYQVLDNSKVEILKELADEEKLQILDKTIGEEGTDTYYIKQIAAPEGYITNEEEIRVDIVKTLNTEENKYQTTVAESTYENVEFVLNGDELDIIFRNEVVPPPLPVFDLQVTKRLTQVRVIRKGVIKTLNKTVDSEIMKVDIPAAQVDETELEIDFDIIIKNVGEVDGWVTELADLFPADFELIDEKGKWVASDVSATTEKYKNKGIAPGGTLTVPVTMKWKLKSDNIGARTNKAKILQYRNEYDLIDPTPDNEGEDGLLVTIKTGGIKSWIGQVFALIVLAFVSLAIVKKLLNSNSEE